MGHDTFESNVAVRLNRENSPQSTNVTQDRAAVWTEEFIEKMSKPRSTPIFDFFYSLVRQLMSMFKFLLGFVAVYMTTMLAFEAFARWRTADSDVIAGGFGVLAVAISVYVTGAYFVRKQKRLPLSSERTILLVVTFLSAGCIEVLGLAPLISWTRVLWPSYPFLGTLAAGGLASFGFWASWPSTLKSMRKHLEKNNVPAA